MDWEITFLKKKSMKNANNYFLIIWNIVGGAYHGRSILSCFGTKLAWGNDQNVYVKI